MAGTPASLCGEELSYDLKHLLQTVTLGRNKLDFVRTISFEICHNNLAYLNRFTEKMNVEHLQEDILQCIRLP